MYIADLSPVHDVIMNLVTNGALTVEDTCHIMDIVIIAQRKGIGMSLFNRARLK